MQNEKKYSIGLDLGTNSVGWAVVDEDYRVMKHKGRHMWGARLWEPAEPAQSTRMLRSSRRRMERRKERIRLLQELFGKDVLAVDDSFFIKLKESFLHNEKEDKVLGRLNIHNLFDGEYSDKNFYAEYPTIYHLRKKLVESQEKMDPRFIYLVMHHIIKYRGNFLYDGDISQFNGSLNSGIEAFFEKLCEGDLDERIPYADKINCITEILASRNIPKYISKKAIKSEQDIKKTKEESIKELFASDKAMQDFVSQFVRAVLGYEFVFQSILFEEVDEAKDKIKIKFSKGYEEKKDEYLNSAGENAEIILLLEAIYNNLLFHEIMCDESTVYAAMIKRFEKHKKDLKTLKMLLREDKKTYADMFRKENAINYGSYIKSTIVGKKSKKTNREDFYTAIKKALENVKDSKEKQAVLSEIDNDTFLPKINDVKNGAIPYQFHLEELKIILHNQGKYYPELEKNADKIISIMSFRRPYSIGVLLSDKTKSRFSWADKRIEERVYPWNFEQLVNVDALSGKFIERMTNNCQYFKDEKVLPLNSITYQRYIVLNELNKIKINDKPISLEMKKKVFDELFCCKKSVSVKDFAFFYNRNYGENIVSNDIQGLSEDEKFLGKMSTLIDFKRIFKEQFSIKNIDTYEKAVKIITLFEDKEIRKRQLKNECNFDNEQINSLSKLSYKKWGKYSYKLLNGIIGKNRKTILQEMYDGINKYGECLHINELLFGEEYGFKEQLPIEEEKINKFAYEKHISNLYCSPDVKRQVWQALNIVEEIEKIMGYAPSDIYLENTRNPEQKKKKESRVDALMKIYSSILEEKGEDYKKYFDNTAYEQLKNQKQNDEKLDNEKLFLYITQMGRCMYSGEKIEISKLNDCEIDHIIPRSYIKDDSFANKVLVKRIENQYKTNNLALSKKVIENQKDFWYFLFRHGLIGNKKYKSLLRNKYEVSDLSGFIHRQLVETNQTVKEVSELLKRRFDCNVQGVKSGLISEFRHQQADKGNLSFIKLRNLNDMHHAKDAYLAAVIGLFTTYSYPCWGNDERALILKRRMESIESDFADLDEYSKTKMFKDLCNKRYSIILDMLENGKEQEFIDHETGEIINVRFNTVLTTMGYNDCIVTKKIEPKANGNFYDQTVYPKDGKLIPKKYYKDKNGTLVPLDPTLYGGYSGEQAEYMVVVKHFIVKKKIQVEAYSLVSIPVLIAYKERLREGAVIEYLENECNFVKPEIVKKVYKGQLIRMNGQLVTIASGSEVTNATQLVIPEKFYKLLQYAEKPKTIIMIDDREYELIFDQSKEFMQLYIEKLRKHYPMYAGIADRVEDFILNQGFDSLSFEKKLDYISKLLIITKTGAGRVDLSAEYGGGSGLGRMGGKTIYPDMVEWIYPSYTGLYQTIVKGVK